MWWDEKNRKWRKHPQCLCERDPCVCRWLDPLDKDGEPIKRTIIEDIREALQPSTPSELVDKGD